MKKISTGCLAVMVGLASAGSALAHHSLANHETTKPIRVKGTIVQFNQINPHSFLYIEEKTADGQMRRWAVEGPSAIQLRQRSMENLVKIGDVVEVCGYGPKEATVWQIASPNGGVSLSGRLLTAELIVLPDGRVQGWGDYGFHHCFPPGYTDAHSR